MKKYNMILTENQPKISALSSGKTNKYEYLTGGEILPSYQSRIKEEANFSYSPPGRAF